MLLARQHNGAGSTPPGGKKSTTPSLASASKHQREAAAKQARLLGLLKGNSIWQEPPTPTGQLSSHMAIDPPDMVAETEPEEPGVRVAGWLPCFGVFLLHLDFDTHGDTQAPLRIVSFEALRHELLEKQAAAHASNPPKRDKAAPSERDTKGKSGTDNAGPSSNTTGVGARGRRGSIDKNTRRGSIDRKRRGTRRIA